MMARIFLLITALMYFAFGLWSITDPAGMTSRLGVEVGGVSGLFEMRGIYGGVSLGAGIFCLLGAMRAKLSFAALCFVATYMGGYMIGRVASLIAGDSAQPSSWMFAGYELVMGLIALTLLLRQRPE
ncbi:DUF4345 family protein [Hyphomonas sp. FCG-A18]|uniref:DUF4345 family protein n=1 Tax=Hyphomonas sp. FCG-A18 TaxID=3080019 RepID=UPI002B2C61B9|nr:DUF4345 family protein [Hyphomonas sp. FCG-A18]